MMRDLTKGKPYSALLRFAVPLYISLLFSSVYGLVDTRIIGSILGEQALASVGATTALSDLLLEFTNGVISGFGIIISRFVGAHDEERSRKAIGHTIILGALLTVAISFITLCFLHPILHLLNIDSALEPDARAYISIIVGGLIASSLYNICAAILRAIGDSITPLIFLIISNIANIGLDYMLVSSFHMGVQGAAWATIITQCISAIACFLYLRYKYPSLRIKRRHLIIDLSLTREMLPAGMSMGFMLSFVLLGSLILQTAINALGQSIIIAHTAARKITILLLIPYFALGTALSTYCSQNLGANLPLRIRDGIRSSILIATIWWVISLGIVWILGGNLIFLITASQETEIINNAVKYLRINSALFMLPAIICILRNSMQGFGDTRTPLISSVIELIGKVAIAFLLVPSLQYMGVIIAEPIVWSIMIIPLLLKWRKQRMTFIQ